MSSQSSSVFFANLHFSVPVSAVRELFERKGRVLGCRTLERKEGRDTLVGFVDYKDPASAIEAVATLAGHTFGQAPHHRLSVKLADSRSNKRSRDADDNNANDASEAAVEFVSSSLAQPGDPVQVCLAEMPLEELYEAVEQLRQMIDDYPDKARSLLHDNPQLRYAVTMILQKQQKLPAELPPEAYGLVVQPAKISAQLMEEMQRQQQEEEAAEMAAATEAAAELDENELATVFALTEDDLSALPPEEAMKLRTLQKHLRNMLGQ